VGLEGDLGGRKIDPGRRRQIRRIQRRPEESHSHGSQGTGPGIEGFCRHSQPYASEEGLAAETGLGAAGR